MKHLNIERLGKILQNTDYPIMYLGVTLDRTLTFKEHCFKTKMKLQARNNLYLENSLEPSGENDLAPCVQPE